MRRNSFTLSGYSPALPTFVSVKTGQKLSKGRPENILTETEKYLKGEQRVYLIVYFENMTHIIC